MSKTKSKAPSAVKSSSKSDIKTDKINLSKVKDARVTKSTTTPKAESKKVAAATAAKVDKKAKTPVKAPASSDESDSDSDSESGSESGSDSESEVEVKASKASKLNGKAKPSKAAANDSDSDSESNSASESGSESEGSEDDSDDESDDEVAKPSLKSAGVANGKVAAEDDDSSDDSEGSSDSDDAEEAPAKAGKTAKAAAVNGAGAAASSSEEDSDDEDDSEGSEGSESDDESEAEAEAPAKKRKAESADEPVAKKAKSDVPANASKNLFVGSLSWNVDDDWLASEFSEFGELTGARVITDRTSGKSKGFGYVEFASVEDAVKAHDAKKGAMLDGREMNVDYSQPRGENVNGFQDRNQRTNQRANQYGDSKSSPSDTLFVGNIAFQATAEMFQEAFAGFGTVTRVTLPTDMNTGELKGFGYIGMSNVEEAQAAFDAMNGSDIAGRAIRLDFAQPRADNGGGRGGRGDSRGGRGGRGGFGGRGRGGDRGGFGGRGRGAPRGRGMSTNRGGIGDFSGQKQKF